MEAARRAAGPVKAGEAVLAHIKQSCRAVRDALAGARLEDHWLSAGPIRPGIRRCGFGSIFLVGNAAGEAHPAVAEGIGMAMQSAWLLCECLTAGQADTLSSQAVDAVRGEYAAVWRRTLAPRIHAAALIAHWTMRPEAVACVLPLLRLFPGVLTAGASFSGKAPTANRLLTEHSLTS
jgi:menaquinone-9 beta-reductase